MKRRIFGLCLLAAAYSAVAGEDWVSWSIQDRPREENQLTDAIELRYLLNDDGQFRLMNSGAKTDPRFEVIGFDRKNHQVWLITNLYERPEYRQRSDKLYRCGSIADPSSRKSYYSICNSRFGVLKGEMAQIDVEKFRRALDEANFFGLISELRLNEYRNAYANANSVAALKRFIEKFADNDPEGLVAQARSKMPAQEGKDYRAAFERAMNTTIQGTRFFRQEALRQFISQYRGNDPEKLTIKAEQELNRLIVDEMKERERHFKGVGEIGNQVCLDLNAFPKSWVDQKGWKDAKYAQLVGFTEQSTPTRLQIQINRIFVWPAYDPWRRESIDKVILNDIQIATGRAVWLDREGWYLCK